MKIFITGIAGFIGSHLADYFINKGYEIFGVDNLLTGQKENINPRANFHLLDIRHKNELTELMQGLQPDWVFHEAAIARTPWTIDDPELCHSTNIDGTFNVLSACKETGNIKKVILASSNIVYAAQTPYWVSKRALEDYAAVFWETYHVRTICLRYSNVYGSLRQSEQGPAVNCIASLRKSKRENGYIWLTGDGTQTRDFTHIDDICRANHLAAESSHTGVFDICTGVNHSMNEVAEYFDCPIQYVPPRRGDVDHIRQDPEPAKAILGFEAITKLEDGIKVYL